MRFVRQSPYLKYNELAFVVYGLHLHHQNGREDYLTRQKPVKQVNDITVRICCDQILRIHPCCQLQPEPVIVHLIFQNAKRGSGEIFDKEATAS